MAHFFKGTHLSDLPVTILRMAAGIMVALHVFIALFVVVQYRWVFMLTAVVMGLLLAREMYEDMARRFFQLKADELEDELEHEDARAAPGVKVIDVQASAPDAEIVEPKGNAARD